MILYLVNSIGLIGIVKVQKLSNLTWMERIELFYCNRRRLIYQILYQFQLAPESCATLTLAHKKLSALNLIADR